MKVYIKVGNKYFKEFKSEIKGYGGHTVFANRVEIKKIVLTDKKNEISALSIKNIISELVDLMRFGDIQSENIKIEVEGNGEI